MLYIHLAAVFGLLLSGFCFLFRGGKEKCSTGCLTFFLFLLAVSVRLLAAGLSRGFDNDTACFAAWADRIYQTGPAAFYSAEVFTDYPPGYMYLLYPIGALRSLLNLEYYSTVHLILLKSPAILCDLGCGLLLYRQGARRFRGLTPFLLCMSYLFNPAVILNSAVWGQVDSVYTLLLIVMCLSLTAGRTLPAYVSFCFGILIKPQMLMFAPVLFAGILDRVFLEDFSVRKLLKNLGWGLMAIGAALLAVLPFGIENVWKQYFSTIGSYPYAAVNACNLWGLFGLNWVSQDNTFLGIPYRIYGWGAITVTVILVLCFSLRRQRDREKYTLLAALLMASVFAFSVRMHERYLYPAVVLLLFCCIYFPSGELFVCYSGLSLLHFYNTAYVLFFYDPSAYDRKAPFILAVSAGTVAFTLLLYHIVFLHCGGRTHTRTLQQNILSDSFPENTPFQTLRPRPFGPLPPRPSQRGGRLKRTDLLCMLVITAVYGCFALYDLGDTQAPSTAYTMRSGESIELDFGASDSGLPAEMAYYIAPGHNRVFTLEQAQEAAWSTVGEITLKHVFTWQKAEITSEGCRLRLTLQSGPASLLELVFLDESGEPLLPVNASDYPALFDEQALYPRRFSFRNSMYFDEIYHGRTAYELLHGLQAYETTHPPLGKLFIAAGIAAFGMNPFGWRITGTLFGIAMLPAIYLFAKKMTKHTPLAALAAVLFAFDFMHFTQTRIATIDVYITFFVLLMYLFMYCYSRISFYDTPLWKTLLPLGGCGICMGLGIASKWTGVYAGAGLAVIFFSVLLRRYREYCFAKESPHLSTGRISHRHILWTFRPYALKTLLFCLVFFVLVPVCIYLASYLPFSDGTGDGLLLRMLHNQEYMFRYHSGLDATHPYSSSWYEWPIIKRPIWYYSGIVTGTSGAGGIREGISAFGNPLVWWAGIPAALYMLWLWARKKDRTAAFLLTGYLAQYLPWLFITRITFIYHYFPSVVFVVLMIIHSMAQWKDTLSKRQLNLLLFIYGAAVFGLFLLFYPVLSGQPVEAEYVNRFLRWFDSWVLTAK